jgi:VCBS repeat-containing protein
MTVDVTPVNDAPVADNETGAVNEDATLDVSDGTSDLLYGDTDVDSGDTLTITTYSHTSATDESNGTASSGNGNSGTAGSSAVIGYYGTLTLAADGTYTYAADQNVTDALDASDTVTDVFTYTLSDGTATDTATLTITITGVNDAPVAVADTDTVQLTDTVTNLTNGAGTVISDDTDADSSSSLSVTSITATTANGSAQTTFSSNTETVIGSYGTLTINSDGSYSYVAGSSVGTDVFTYVVSDGSLTSSTTLTFSVTAGNPPVAANDTDSVNEDATVTQSTGSGLLVADDTDADGNTLTVTQIAVTGSGDNAVTASSTYNSGSPETVTGTYGQLTVGADGSYTYVANQSAADDLDAGDRVTDSFTYTVSDGINTDTATLIITVTGINDAPVAVNDTDTVNEDATVTRSSGSNLLMDDDSDADDDDSFTVTQIAVTGQSNSAVDAGSSYNSNGTSITGTYGTLTVGADGTYTYVADQSAADDLDLNDPATDSFTYTISDGDTTDTATLIFTVTGVNDLPTASNNTITTNEDTNHVFSTNDFNFIDVDDSGSLNKIKITSLEDNGALQYYNGSAWVDVTLNQEITATDITNDKLRFKPDTNENGTSYTSFEFQVSDGTAYSSSSYTMTVNVTAVNDAPSATNDTVSVNEDATTTVSSASSGVIDDNDTDPDSSDTLTITNIAHTNGNTESVTASTTYSNGQTIIGTYGTLTIGADGTYTYVADQSVTDALDGSDEEDDVFTYTLSDGTTTTTATITVTVTGVNDSPVANDDIGAVDEDATLTVSTASSGVTQNNDTDSDADDAASTLVVNQITPNAGSASSVSSGTTYSNGTVVTGTYGTLTIGANGTYTYVADQSDADDLDAGDTATDVFTYRVTDTTGATATADITITVTGINDAPTASDNTVSTAEDTPYVFSTSDFGYTDADDNDSLVSITITTLETNGALQYYNGSTWVDVTLNQVITVSDITSGYLRLNPDANENGSPYTTIKFTVNDGDADSATPNTITVNVTAVNDAPVASDDTASVNEDATTTVSSASNGVIDDNDTDTESDTLIITNITHTNGNTESVTASTTYLNGQSIVGTYGTLTIGSNGTYTYVADQDATDALDLSDQVTDVFTYTISDQNGGTDTASITVTVTGVNDAPTSTGGTITTNEDENYTLTVNDFNFSDPDDSGSLNKVKITTLETNGNLEYYNGTAWVAVTLNQEITASDITSGYLRFRPDANENGSSYTTFGYQVSDGTVYSSATTMTVNVAAVNDAPVATDDASSVSEDSNVRVKANEDDLLNDDSDTENDSLTVTLIKPLNGSNTSVSNGSSTTITGTYGQLTVNSNGSYTYKANQDAADTLDTGESAQEQFVYTVSDGNGGTDTGILTITINGVEDNPNAVKDNVSLNISQSSTLTGNAITNDIDPDDSLTIVGCGQGRNPNVGTAQTVGTAFDSNYGQMTINADGTYTFVVVSNIKDLLDPGQSVTEKFYYTISDGNSTSTAVIELTVQRDNVVQELTRKEQKQIRKQIAKDRLNEPSTIRLPNKIDSSKTIEQTADAFDSINSTKKLSFSEGIKLVDLVAETGSLTTTDGSLDKVRAKEKDGQLNLKFKVSTDLGNQIVRYEGVMPDGSKLPDWIKVDPQTGKTTTNIPEGVEQVDFTIIATDQQNNKKEIAVSIDPKEIKEDKSIFKQAKKQDASLSVDQSGNVNIVQKDENGDVNQTETKNLNANEKQNTSNITTQDLNLDNANDIKNIIDTIKSDQVYQLQTINNGETLEIKVPETLLGNFEKTKLVLKDGSAIPDWVEFDPITGEINANPPEDVNKLEFKLIIELDGEIIVKDLAVDVGSDDNAQILDNKEDTKFIAFKDQLNKEHDNWEEYGSNIINRL